MTKDDKINLAIGLSSVFAGIFALSSDSNPYNNTAYTAGMVLSVVFTGCAVVLSLYLSRKNKRKDRIFISYNEKDRDKVIEIASKIKEFGYKTWLDINEVFPGQNFADEIRKGIENSSVFLVILSENYNSSFAAKEFELAMSIMRSNDKTFSPVLPIIIGDTPVSSIPEALRSIQWLDLRKNEEEGYKKLKEGLQRILGKEN